MNCIKILKTLLIWFFHYYQNAQNEKKKSIFAENYLFKEMCLKNVPKSAHKTCFQFHCIVFSISKKFKERCFFLVKKISLNVFYLLPLHHYGLWCKIPGNNEFSPDEDPHVVADCIKVYHMITNGSYHLHLLHFHLGVQQFYNQMISFPNLLFPCCNFSVCPSGVTIITYACTLLQCSIESIS